MICHAPTKDYRCETIRLHVPSLRMCEQLIRDGPCRAKADPDRTGHTSLSADVRRMSGSRVACRPLLLPEMRTEDRQTCRLSRGAAKLRGREWLPGLWGAAGRPAGEASCTLTVLSADAGAV